MINYHFKPNRCCVSNFSGNLILFTHLYRNWAWILTPLFHIRRIYLNFFRIVTSQSELLLKETFYSPNWTQFHSILLSSLKSSETLRHEMFQYSMHSAKIWKVLVIYVVVVSLSLKDDSWQSFRLKGYRFISKELLRSRYHRLTMIYMSALIKHCV